jgi:hypothetical protein
MVGSSPAQQEADGLDGRMLAIWQAERGTSDSSSKIRDGKVVGELTYTEGVVGSAFEFGGASGIDFEQVPFESGDYTIAGWFRTSSSKLQPIVVVSEVNLATIQIEGDSRTEAGTLSFEHRPRGKAGGGITLF